MYTDQLKTFLTLEKTRNFSRAAVELLVSQSTVSKRIAELEKELGHRLFNRERGGVQLTTAGRALLNYADKIVNLEEKAKVQIAHTSQFSGYLVLGTAYAYYENALCHLLTPFLQQHPDISVRLKFAHSQALLKELRRTMVDIAFTHYPLYDLEYDCQHIGSDDLLLVTAYDNDVYADGIACEKLKTLPMIDTNFLYPPTRKHLFPPPYQFSLSVDIASHALPLLPKSHWYTIITRTHAHKALESHILREIPLLDGTLPPVEYYMSYNTRHAMQPEMKTFLHFFETQKQKELSSH